MDTEKLIDQIIFCIEVLPREVARDAIRQLLSRAVPSNPVEKTGPGRDLAFAKMGNHTTADGRKMDVFTLTINSDLPHGIRDNEELKARLDQWNQEAKDIIRKSLR